MTDKFDKLIESARGAHLKAEEKASMRLSLSRMADMTPVNSPFWSFTFIKSYHYVPAFILLFLLIGGGTSILAQGSLPGDTLYPMKIDVNEKMESFLAVSPQAKAEVDAVQADRRLAEAQALATKGDLTETQNTAIKQAFSQKVLALNNHFAEMQANGQTESAIAVLKKFDLDVKDRVNNLAQVPDVTENKKSASDIVTFIKTEHSDESDTNSDTSEDTSQTAPDVTTMSVMMAASSTASTTSVSSTTIEMKVDTNKASSIQKRHGNNKQVQVRWSWRDDN